MQLYVGKNGTDKARSKYRKVQFVAEKKPSLLGNSDEFLS